MNGKKEKTHRYKNLSIFWLESGNTGSFFSKPKELTIAWFLTAEWKPWVLEGPEWEGLFGGVAFPWSGAKRTGKGNTVKVKYLLSVPSAVGIGI